MVDLTLHRARWREGGREGGKKGRREGRTPAGLPVSSNEGVVGVGRRHVWRFSPPASTPQLDDGSEFLF